MRWMYIEQQQKQRWDEKEKKKTEKYHSQVRKGGLNSLKYKNPERHC